METSYRKIILSNQWHCNAFDLKFKISNSLEIFKNQCQTRIKVWRVREASRLLHSAPSAPFARAGVVPYMAVGEVRLKGVCELLRIIGVPARASLGGRPMPEESSSPASTNTNLPKIYFICVSFARTRRRKIGKRSQGGRDLQCFATSTLRPKAQLSESINYDSESGGVVLQPTAFLEWTKLFQTGKTCRGSSSSGISSQCVHSHQNTCCWRDTFKCVYSRHASRTYG